MQEDPTSQMGKPRRQQRGNLCYAPAHFLTQTAFHLYLNRALTCFVPLPPFVLLPKSPSRYSLGYHYSYLWILLANLDPDLGQRKHPIGESRKEKGAKKRRRKER